MSRIGGDVRQERADDGKGAQFEVEGNEQLDVGDQIEIFQDAARDQFLAVAQLQRVEPQPPEPKLLIVLELDQQGRQAGEQQCVEVLAVLDVVGQQHRGNHRLDAGDGVGPVRQQPLVGGIRRVERQVPSQAAVGAEAGAADDLQVMVDGAVRMRDAFEAQRQLDLAANQMAAFQFDHEAGAADHPRVVRRRMHLHLQRTADAAIIKANHDLR